MFLLLVLLCSSALLDAAQVNVAQIQAVQAKEYTFNLKKIWAEHLLRVSTSIQNNNSGYEWEHHEDYYMEKNQDGKLVLEHMGNGTSEEIGAEKETEKLKAIFEKAKIKLFKETNDYSLSLKVLKMRDQIFNFNESELE